MHPEIILASTSPYRRALLERLGLPFRCVAPGVDEAAASRECTSPHELAERLAFLKADAVAEQFPDCVVIGSDQLAAIDGEVLGKPGTSERAIEQLERLSGRTHELVTAVALVQHSTGRNARHTNVTRLLMRPLSRAAIVRYVERDAPLDCAGSYKIESAGIALFDRIETADFTAITGLPLMALVDMLATIFGIELP